MIVIATNNGIAVLPKLIDSLHATGHVPAELLIMDTGTTEALSREYLCELMARGYNDCRTS